MIFVEACLYAVSSCVLLAIGLAFAFGGLSPALACASLAGGAAVAAWTFWKGRDRPSPRRQSLDCWEWTAIVVFALFSLRAFLWVVFADGDEIKVLSVNNLGDLSLHLTYIRELANGAAFWPDNPIYSGAKLTYPIGIDLFHSLLTLAGVDIFRAFVWMGLAGCLCTGLALWRWGGAFTLLGFLCNGGLAGFLFFKTGQMVDFQKDLAWKSIPLALFVTQRGLLFALPAGLLLLSSWRTRFFRSGGHPSASATSSASGASELLPWWGELLLYASMPVFHVHTFLFLSLMLLAWFIVHAPARRSIAWLVGAAFLPATLLVLLITANLHGPSVLGWSPGWMQSDADWLAVCAEHLHVSSHFVTIPLFWLFNFGVLPLLIGVLLWQIVRRPRLVWARAAVFPALALFVLCCFVKFAPWAWDNTKMMIWSYLVVLPFLWRHVLARRPVWQAALACFLLFWSGFASLLGGLGGSERGYAIASRTELDEIADALRQIPPAARFVAHPDYNHPLLLQGRKLALGYEGHVWSHGYAWAEPSAKVNAIMNGENNWPKLARELQVRYLFWGARERDAYPDSTETWRSTARVVASGDWGEILDIAASAPPREAPQ